MLNEGLDELNRWKFDYRQRGGDPIDCLSVLLQNEQESARKFQETVDAHRRATRRP
jgi:hypothetical protein